MTENILLDLPTIFSKYGIWLLLLLIVPFIAKKGYQLTKEKSMLKKLAKSGMYDIDRMDGLQFEVYLKALLKELGYKSEVTKGSNDFGADLIMKKENKKVVIQAKRYGYKNKVGINAIQQVYAAKPYYKADECWIMTNSIFTKQAKELAEACNVKLFDRYKLAEFINKVNGNTTPDKIINTVSPETRKCPNCDGDLIKRTSKAGNHFMGCTNYPNCTHTEPIAK